MTHALGYLIDHPVAVAARNDPHNYPMALLAPQAISVPADFDTDLGPVLDQNGVGACVAFSATSVKSYQEKLDTGGWDFTTPSAFRAYDWLKHGHDTWPGDGVDAEGSYPLAVWKMAKQVGIPDATGKGRLITAYYQLQGTPGTGAWVDTQQAVIYQHGPVTVSSAWPNNWWMCPTTGLLPYPQGTAGAHQWVRKGWTMNGPIGPVSVGKSPTGRYWRHRQSWGQYGATDRFGRSGEFLLPFEADAEYPIARIGEIWKTVDFDDPPKPGGESVVPAYDKVPRLVDAPAGTQLYAAETNAPLVKLTTAAKLYSPFAISTSQYGAVVVTGGKQQLVRVNKSAVTVVANSPIT